MLTVIGIGLLVAAGGLAPAGRATGAAPIPTAPQLQLSQDSAPPGATVGAIGSGFTPGTGVRLDLVQAGVADSVAVVSVGPDGTFNASVAVPSDASPGLAEFMATSVSVPNEEAAAPFFVDTSEPIGDQPPGPPAERVKVCEVVIVLDKVRNRLLNPTDVDKDTLFIESYAVLSRRPHAARPEVNVEAKRNEFSTVASSISRFQRPKQAFPTDLYIRAVVEQVRQPGGFNNPIGLEFQIKKVNCPDTVVFEFSAKVHTKKHRDPIGEVDFIYRVTVREVEAQ
jgi:hypothetical protein